MSQPYPTDLTDPEWAILLPLIPAVKPGGRPRTTDMREVVNAIVYVLRSGCQWRLLPTAFPSWDFRTRFSSRRYVVTCCWCRWSHPATMAIRTWRIIALLRLAVMTKLCDPVYCQPEQLQWRRDGWDFQPYEGCSQS